MQQSITIGRWLGNRRKERMGFGDTLNGGQGGREVRRGSKTSSLDNQESCGVLQKCDF